MSKVLVQGNSEHVFPWTPSLVSANILLTIGHHWLNSESRGRVVHLLMRGTPKCFCPGSLYLSLKVTRPSFIEMFLKIFVYVHNDVRMNEIHICHVAHVEVREQHSRLVCFLPSRGSGNETQSADLYSHVLFKMCGWPVVSPFYFKSFSSSVV